MVMSKYNLPAQADYQLSEQNKALDKSNEQASATISMRNGQRLVIAGFVIASLGILIYCASTFSVGFSSEVPALAKGGLAVIAAGVLCWFVGAIKYFQGAIDSNSPDELF